MASRKQGKTFGYARVSSRDQNLDRQLVALREFGITPRRLFTDKACGANFERPGYCELKGKMLSGDALVITSIDRLGRNYDEILEEWRIITRDIGADITVLDMPLLDTRNGAEGVTGRLISDIVLQLLSYVAQVEREGIRQRQVEGIAAAQARGVRFGRPRKAIPEDFLVVSEMYLAGLVSRSDAAELLDVSERTFSRWMHDADMLIQAAG